MIDGREYPHGAAVRAVIEEAAQELSARHIPAEFEARLITCDQHGPMLPSLAAQRFAPSGRQVLALLIERNPWADRYPNQALAPTRVYKAPGQAVPPLRFVVRPGERLRVRVDNQDAYVHSFTLPQAGVDLHAWPRQPSTTREFRAPTEPGVYTFFCRWGNARGMSGRLIVAELNTGSGV